MTLGSGGTHPYLCALLQHKSVLFLCVRVCSTSHTTTCCCVYYVLLLHKSVLQGREVGKGGGANVCALQYM